MPPLHRERTGTRGQQHQRGQQRRQQADKQRGQREPARLPGRAGLAALLLHLAEQFRSVAQPLRLLVVAHRGLPRARPMPVIALLDVAHMPVKLVESLGPDLPMLVKPPRGHVQCLRLEAARADWARRARERSPPRSSTFRSLEIADSIISTGSASSFTVASPAASLAWIPRLVGSASAANVASRRSLATVMATASAARRAAALRHHSAAS